MGFNPFKAIKRAFTPPKWVRKFQPKDIGKLQPKDVGNALKTVAPALLGATGFGLPLAAGVGAGLSAIGAGRKTNLGTVLGGAAQGAGAGMAGGAIGGAARGAVSGFNAGDGLLSALGGAGRGAASGLYSGTQGTMSAKDLVSRMPSLGGGGGAAQTSQIAPGLATNATAGAASTGLSALEKGALISQGLSGVGSVYGGYQEGAMADREFGMREEAFRTDQDAIARQLEERDAAAKAFGPILQQYFAARGR